MLGTVLYFLKDRTVERIDLSQGDRRRLVSALEEAVPAGGRIVGMILGDTAKPLVRFTAQSDRLTGRTARPRELSNA